MVQTSLLVLNRDTDRRSACESFELKAKPVNQRAEWNDVICKSWRCEVTLNMSKHTTGKQDAAKTAECPSQLHKFKLKWSNMSYVCTSEVLMTAKGLNSLLFSCESRQWWCSFWCFLCSVEWTYRRSKERKLTDEPVVFQCDHKGAVLLYSNHCSGYFQWWRKYSYLLLL